MFLPPIRTIFAVGQYKLDACHVIRRHAISQRVRPTGIFRDVLPPIVHAFWLRRIGRGKTSEVLDRRETNPD